MKIARALMPTLFALLGACAPTAASPEPAAPTNAPPAPSLPPAPPNSAVAAPAEAPVPANVVTTPTAAPLEFPAAGELVVEAEGMTLSGCELVDDAAASGKKAVVPRGPNAWGSVEIQFPTGKYSITVWENAPDGDHDAFYTGLGETLMRYYPDNKAQKTWAMAEQTLDFEIKQPSKKLLKFAVTWPGARRGEDGMKIDRFVIAKK